MRNRDLRRFYLGAVILFAASCAQIVGMEEGVLRQDGPIIECKVFEDCLASGTECRVPETCTDGKCQFKNTIRDKLVMNQTAGDCKKTVCDGQGSTEDVVDDTDVHDDENDCTADSCNGGDAVHMPIPDKMLDCYTGPEGTEGVGICAPGKRACDAQGQPGKTCDGQVLPQSEVCDISPLDEDCNGMTNETGAEGGTCSCGDNVISAAIGEICDDGNVIGGDECSPICSPVKLVQLASGCHTTCAVFSDDTVKCWGYNMNGQLGIGSTMNIGSASGQMGAKLAVTPFPSGKKVLKIAGQLTFCALLDDHALRCWGLNDFGQLGEGNTNNRGDNPMEMGDMLPAVDLGPGEMVTDFAVGGHHVCAIVTGGAVKCWGAGIVGQLGMENNNNRGGNMGQMGANVPMTPLGTGVTVKQIAAGDAHNCVITADDRVKCWGFAQNGELGLEDPVSRGNKVGQMGDNLPYVNLGTNRTAKKIASRGNHTCAILDDGSVKCWGHNNYGQLGLGDIADRGRFTGGMGDNLETVQLGTGRTAIAIVVHSSDTCVLLDNSTIKCWGYNGNGNLGLGNTDHRGDGPNEMGDNLPAVDLGTGRTPLTLTAGNQFTCVVFDDTSVKCWGHNAAEGRLGLGDAQNRGDGANEMGDNLPIVKLFANTW